MEGKVSDFTPPIICPPKVLFTGFHLLDSRKTFITSFLACIVREGLEVFALVGPGTSASPVTQGSTLLRYRFVVLWVLCVCDKNFPSNTPTRLLFLSSFSFHKVRCRLAVYGGAEALQGLSLRSVPTCGVATGQSSDQFPYSPSESPRGLPQSSPEPRRIP